MTAIGQARILILEDDPGVAKLMQLRLQRAGYSVSTTATAEEAVRHLEKNDAELLLLDYSLPGPETGLDFHLQLQQRGWNLPVIIVTGLSDESTVIRAMRAGVRDFVTKSVEYLNYLPEAVERVLKQIETEQQFIESEKRVREQAALLELANDAILVRDLEDRIVYWNKGAERLYGWSAAEAMSKTATEILFPFLTREQEEAHQRVLQKGEWRGELRQITREAKEIAVSSRWTLVRDEEGNPKAILIINSDITEKKSLEAQLLQAQRMEALGVLAGGVAHDFNNLLTIISGYSELLLQTLRPEDTSYSLISEIRRAGQRAASLTRQLLAFSRKQVLQPETLDLNELIANLEKMLRRLIGEDIQLTTTYDEEAGPIRADPAQLEQVIMNLVVNARDAMPVGGKLAIETRYIKLDSSYSRSHLEIKAGEYVLLIVSDTGCGMEEETRARIFDPFFTTKAPDRGTGLGLATVYGIVKQSGGHIEVESELDKGTTFRIFFPRVPKQDLPRKSSPSFLHIPRGSETILLVEDEEHVRSLARTVLQTQGYRVLAASDGEEALKMCRQYGNSIHLLVSDVIMPKMSGRQLADLVIAQRPDTKVLFVSGYTDDAIVRHGIVEAGVAFLQKPFSTASLGRKVREVLDAVEKPA